MCIRFALLMLVVCPAPSIAQGDPIEESWRWVRFTTNSGLPSNIVKVIDDAPDGTPWAWTENGVAWYDGYQWHTVEASRKLAFGTAGIAGFFKHGVVLSVADGYSIASRTGMSPFPVDSIDGIWFLKPDSAVVWRNQALYSYCNASLRPLPVPADLADAHVIGAYNSGRIIINEKGSELTAYGPQRTSLIDVSCARITHNDVTENAAGQGLAILLFPRSHQGIWEWNRNGAARRTPFRTTRHGLATDVAANGDALVLFEDSFLRIRKNGKWSTVRLPDFVHDVTDVRFRRNGDLWLATQHGAYLCRRTLRPWTQHAWAEGDLRNRVNNVLRAKDGSLWLATTGGVVDIRPDGRTRTVNSIGRTRIAVVTGLAEDRDGCIWISSGSEFPGAYRWDGKSWRHVPIIFRGQPVQVHDIASDSKGRLWFLCMANGWDLRAGMNPGVYTLQDGHIERWPGSDRLPHQRVYSFAEGPDGALWFGTHDGVARWDGRVWKIWRRHGGSVKGPVTTLAVDHARRVWFGMQRQGHGIGMIDISDTVRYFTTRDGLPNECVWDIEIDGRGRVWATTQKGLVCRDADTWMAFDERSGLGETLLWPVLPGDSTVIVGTINNGWAEFRPGTLTMSTPRLLLNRPVVDRDHALLSWRAFTAWGSIPPENILTRYRINDGTWSDWTAEHSLLLDSASVGDYRVQVQAMGLFGQYDASGQTAVFTIDAPLFERWYIRVPASIVVLIIAGLSMQLHRRRKAYVRELGKSESRHRMITELMSDYAYLFRVREDSTVELVWMTDSFTQVTGYPAWVTEERDFVKRLVHPDDLQTALEAHQRLLAGEKLNLEHRIVTQSGETRWVERRSSPVFNSANHRVEFIYGVVSDITARKEAELRMRSLASELVSTEERERRRMAEYLHDVIGQSLTMSYLKLHRWQMREHPQDQTLDEIRAMLDQILQDAHTLTFDLCPPIIFELSLREALEWLVTRMNSQHDVAIQAELGEETVFVTPDLHVLLFQAVRELLVNSIKHAKANLIRLEMHRSDGLVRIVVRDDGVGFDPWTLEACTSERGGFGLFNIKERLSDFGAKLEIKNGQDRGTCIAILAPVQRDS